MRRVIAIALLGCVCLSTLSGCRYYSFTGATIPSHLNTIAIPLAIDNSLSTLAGLDEQLTSLLVERFVGQTRLSLETDDTQANALLSARLDRYLNQPTSVSGQERATRNRITITVSVEYTDQVNSEVLLERSFSGFEDYDPIAEGLDGETTAATTALEIIADDIFTAATSNW